MTVRVYFNIPSGHGPRVVGFAATPASCISIRRTNRYRERIHPTTHPGTS